MKSRVERTTSCPGCRKVVLVKKARPEATRRKYCEDCLRHPEYNRFSRVVFKFDTDFTELETCYSKTHCEICKEELYTGGSGPGRSHNRQRQIDHDHDTGKIRGVLCWNCNTAIGKLGDDVAGLERALAYLNKHYSTPKNGGSNE